jgi:hypothetical protein
MAGLVRWLKMAVCRFIGIVATLAGYGLIVGAFFVLLFQGILWLRDGYWPAWQVRQVWYALELPAEPLPWLGAEKIRTWLLDLPIAGALVPIGVAAFLAGTFLMVLAESFENEPASHKMTR